jgi:HSP20 family protein
MATETLRIRKTTSIADQIEKIHERIMRRAYDIFAANGGIFGKDLDNWLAAERELFWKPAIELREKDNEFLVDIAVPGIDAKDLEIEVTADDVLIKGETQHEHEEDKGTVHTCELQSGSVLRTIHFPKQVNADDVKAEFKKGMLHLKAPIAEEQRAEKVKIEAA